MTTIKTSQNGLDIELTIPEPIEQKGQWWGVVAARLAKQGETFCMFGDFKPDGEAVIDFSFTPCWIWKPIPRATPEQLKVIGMRERDGRPVKCVEGDYIWINNTCKYGCSAGGCDGVGAYRFVLVPAEPPKAEKDNDHSNYPIALQRAIEHHCNGVLIPESIAKQCPHHATMLNDRLSEVVTKTEPPPRHENEFDGPVPGPEVGAKHYSCVGCQHPADHSTCEECRRGWNFEHGDYLRYNYKPITPAPQEPRYSIPEIRAYMEGKMICGIDMDSIPHNAQLGVAIRNLEHPHCGIAAVTTKGEK